MRGHRKREEKKEKEEKRKKRERKEYGSRMGVRRRNEHMVRQVRPRCAYDVAWWQRGQGRAEGWVYKRDEGRKSLDVPREGPREYEEGTRWRRR